MAGGALAIAAVTLAFLFWRKKLPRFTAFLAIAVGAGLIGGTVGQVQHQITTSLSTATSQITAQLLGVAAVAVLGVLTVLWFGHDLMAGTASRGTAVVGFMLPLTVVLIPGTVGMLMASMVHLVETTIGGLITSLSTGHATAPARTRP